MKKLIFAIIVIVNTLCYSQEKVEYIDYETISKEINNLSEKKEYDNIIGIINKVNKNDSIYSPLQVTKSYYLMQLKKHEEVIKITKIGLQNSDRNESLSFYINQSLSYWYLKDFENAFKSIDEGLKEFPKNFTLFYNKGLFYYDLEKYENALEMFIISANLNPFNPNVHLKIGNICYKQHLTAQALMSFSTYLLLNPDGAGSFAVLNSLNKLLGKENVNKKIKGLKISSDDDAFEEIDLILDNRIALSSDYKIDNEINIAFVKQNHALFQTLNSFNGNGGFWDLTYVELYKWIASNDYFDNFIYTTTYSIENPKFKKIVEKKREDVIEFIKLFKNKLKDIFEKNEMIFNEKKQVASFHYANYRLDGIGTKKNEIFFGNWEYFNSEGKLQSKGEFDNDGNKIGKWVWFYNNGKIKETANYLKGNLEGKNKAYYKNGKIKYTTTYNNNLLDGLYKFYNEQGALIQEKTFKKGELDGIYNSYYPVGKLAKEFNIPYKNGNPIGKVTQFFPNKRKQFEATYINGKKQGKEIEYFANDTLKTIFDMVDGKFQGSFKEYYKNGVLLEEGKGLDGLNTGNWKTYYPDGSLEFEYTYKKGMRDGAYLEYAPNGKLYYEFNYRNDELIAYKFFNQEGGIIKEARKKGGKFFYEGYSINGNKTAEGLYNIKGGKDGEWKFYTDNGVLLSKGIFEDGEAQGKHYSYYNNGEIESISNFEDDILTGYYTSYYDNRKMNSQGYYNENIQNKEWRYYYKDGILMSINFYHKGKLHGEQKYYSVEGKLNQILFFGYGNLISEKNYDINGILLEEIIYKNSPQDFIAISHYPNKKKFIEITHKFNIKHGAYNLSDYYGNKIIEGNYFNGKISGNWTWYYPNGNKKREGTLIDDEYDGIVNLYYENGNLEDKYEYNLGVLNNTSYSYAEDGETLTGSIEYLNGKKHGKRRFYSEGGKLQLIRFYEHGRLIGYSYLDKENNELPMIKIKNETAKIVSYYDNGNKAREMEIINGDMVNDYKSYYYNGNLYSKHFNKNDDYDGKHILYYSTGKTKEEIMYINGEKNGLSKKYYPNGQLKEIVNYINNSKSGEAKYYDENGILTKNEKYFNDNVYE